MKEIKNKLTPRQEWFKNRVNECLENIREIQKLEDWKQYRDQAHTLAIELLYATSEWDKYYRNLAEEKL